MYRSDIRKRVLAAADLLDQTKTSKDKLSSIAALLKGVNPRIDLLLSTINKQLTTLEKIHSGDVIELTVEHIPETDEKNKKRKKLLLLLIKNWKQLKGEVERIKKEFDLQETQKQSQADTFGKITLKAKGPLGIITVGAIAIVIGSTLLQNKNDISPNEPSNNSVSNNSATLPEKNKIKVISAGGKYIPVSELTTGIGTECMSDNKPASHYHAKDHTSAKAMDGTQITDPGGCGFGKVSEVAVQEIE